MRIPYLVRRPSGFYWQPNAKLRALGLKFAALGKNEAEAITRASALNEQAKWVKRGKATPPLEGTVKWLIVRYQADDMYLRTAPATKVQYDWCHRMIEELWGDLPLTELTPPVIRAWYYDAKRKHSLHTAAAMFTAMKVLMKFAVVSGALPLNPMRELEKETPPPRQKVWPEKAITAFLAVAEAEGRPSIALAIRIGLDTGQRLGDVLRLTWAQYDGSAIELRQGKTKAQVRVPVTPDLRAALAVAPRRGVQIVVSEATGQPYRLRNFNKAFLEIAAEVGSEEYQFRDLRRTAVVSLARAGCTVPQIAAITGHSIKSVHQIMTVYLPPDGTVAGEGIKKLVDFRNRDGTKSL